MSRPIIPKEQLSAYQRWELDSFDENQSDPGITLPTAEEIEQIHRNAHQEGYTAGRQQGHGEGYDEGYKQGMAEATEKVNLIRSILSDANQELARLDREISEDLLSLALAIARQVLLQSIEAKPEVLLSIIRESIARLPPFNQHANLRVNPEDALLVREQLGEQLEHTGWKIIEDERIARGGCKLETSSSHVDASLEKRWEKVTSAIAKNSEWLP